MDPMTDCALDWLNFSLSANAKVPETLCRHNHEKRD